MSLSVMSQLRPIKSRLCCWSDQLTPRDFHLQNKKKDALVDIERFKIRNGDDRSLIMVEHAWCLETVELGYRNVSLSGHPVRSQVSASSLLSCPSDTISRAVTGQGSPSPRQCFDRSDQVNNNSIVTASNTLK